MESPNSPAGLDKDKPLRISEESVDTWLESLADERADELRTLDTMISEAFSGDSRVLWVGKFWGGTDQTIIGYGDMYQPRPKGDPVHWFVVGLALQKANISLYVNAARDGSYLAKLYASRLGKVKAGSASLGFKSLADLDSEVLREMLQEARQLTKP